VARLAPFASMPGFLARTPQSPPGLPRTATVNGVRLQYVEQGAGEPIVFVHGALSGPGAWDPVREEIAEKYPYRFITYSQRYYGTGPWQDEGQKFSVATHADDLAAFITSLDAGPVHLVGWSYGGAVAAAAALKNPSLVRSLVLYEATILSVLPPDSPEGRAAREDRAKLLDPVIAASKAGDAVRAIRLMYEAVYQLPPGGFDRLPQANQSRVLDNARTIPLLVEALATPAITCHALRNLSRPTLVMQGEKTQAFYALITERIGKCVPGAERVVLPNANHAGPVRDSAAFAAAVFDFLSKH
jgi:pimeloyl-ACP methyl ester carboxylesterase